MSWRQLFDLGDEEGSKGEGKERSFLVDQVFKNNSSGPTTKVILILLTENLKKSGMWGHVNFQPHHLGKMIVYSSSSLLSMYHGNVL